MPSLAQHQSNDFTKLLIEGDSGSGKSGSLTSLVKAGYKLRILDFDNGLEPLKQFVLRDCPDKIDNVEFRTLRDKVKASPEGPILDGMAKAFIEGVKMLDRWKYKTDEGIEVDLGKPATWGPDCILVLDSMTFMGDAAMNWREQLSPKTSKKGTEYDGRAVFYDAQKAIEDVIALLTSEAFRTNVIVLTHIRYMTGEDGRQKGYPTAVGKALGPTIPRYFNSVALCQTSAGGKRTIQTVATAMIDLKNPKPFAMAPSYPIETGLADFFGALREPPTQTKPIQPKLATIRK
ncbi:MAG: AAA family ATPase [Patescibacteria group bacterium]|nr:AAA family ATPase [Patescibacteria group bacterium]